MQQYLQWWRDFVDWQQQRRPVVLVTVVRADGSTPREVGATMVLGLDQQQQIQQSDTIGGGHLEFQAIDIAKDMLLGHEVRQRFTERFNLSARLGQCCGGVMWLLFERIGARLNCYDLIVSQKAWQNGQNIVRHVSDQQASVWYSADHPMQALQADWQRNDEHWQWRQIIQPYAMKVMILGAGHVGEAIVRCLLPLDVQVTWVDNRDHIFPLDLQDQIRCISTDLPALEITHFDRDGAILILTHDHQLDLQLCFEALKPTQQSFAYVGMIGSKSKRAIFEKRMQARGYSSTQLEQLVCPIGIDGITSKKPAMIAIAVVAELLQVFDITK
ncbi:MULTISPECIES: xanthine dehydrogenase accessory protein XdhC [unclassified Acinetobacter]|uniref:xanthine dehydrogenase accessory protein XdhC n=1 Tax=unclassified Acinetobacter TaxID=196816 RepID=UPI00190DCA9C|nr:MULTISPECIES: xanthine dehydrogenase accessory protein XdhC [unclassified Acinetobacter]MBK0063599.1 xanthine dehydrogenase accessory protein XdhC [Acinetobacter sp. S55]MBK0067477.1 xanthine dehydrogenase accessory protein XdhC [Acinetobacter sp. S54]